MAKFREQVEVHTDDIYLKGLNCFKQKLPINTIVPIYFTEEETLDGEEKKSQNQCLPGTAKETGLGCDEERCKLTISFPSFCLTPICTTKINTCQWDLYTYMFR